MEDKKEGEMLYVEALGIWQTDGDEGVYWLCK